MPYFSPRRPPLFSATLPPMVEIFHRARIGRVKQAHAVRHVGDLLRDDAGLDEDREIFLVEFEHAIHLRGAKDDAAVRRHAAAAEPRAAAASDDRDAICRSVFHDGGDLVSRLHHHDDCGHAAEGRGAVVAVREKMLARVQHACGVEQGGQVGDEIRHGGELVCCDGRLGQIGL